MALEYSIDRVDLKGLKATGKGTIRGGVGPAKPLHHYPLLAWMPLHHRHGSHVFTEDQKASVLDIAAAVVQTPSFEVIADRFGTTVEHVRQALDYAMECGIIA